MSIVSKYKKGDTIRVLDNGEKIFILDENARTEVYCASSDESLLRKGVYDYTYCLTRKDIISCKSLLIEKL